MDLALNTAGRDAKGGTSSGSPVGTLGAMFQRMTERSRTLPPPTLGERLDRLARLRAAIADNETRFEAAISADFGHRCATETAIAETLLVLGEIRHAAAHLKAWMKPRRIATQPQFWPGKNRLIPQPVGVVGVIAPWNYPLQLTRRPRWPRWRRATGS